MVEKLKLALKNPVLPLAFKAGLLVLAVFWLRSGGITGFKTFIFLLLFLALYLKPKTNVGQFFISSVVWATLVFWTPNIGGLMGSYINLVLGGLAFILLGVKNLIFFRRQGAYYLLHLMLVVGVTSLFFLGSLSQVFLFIVLFFLFREFYSTIVNKDPGLINLVAAAESMLVLQSAWIASFFPTSFLVSASFLVLITFIFHDILVSHFKGIFTKELALRNLGLFIILSALILLMPVWGFQ